MVKDEIVYYVTEGKINKGTFKHAVITVDDNHDGYENYPRYIFETESEAKEYLKCQVKKQILELEQKLQELREV